MASPVTLHARSGGAGYQSSLIGLRTTQRRVKSMNEPVVVLIVAGLLVGASLDSQSYAVRIIVEPPATSCLPPAGRSYMYSTCGTRTQSSIPPSPRPSPLCIHGLVQKSTNPRVPPITQLPSSRIARERGRHGCVHGKRTGKSHNQPSPFLPSRRLTKRLALPPRGRVCWGFRCASALFLPPPACLLRDARHLISPRY